MYVTVSPFPQSRLSLSLAFPSSPTTTNTKVCLLHYVALLLAAEKAAEKVSEKVANAKYSIADPKDADSDVARGLRGNPMRVCR